ncbi:hypothetical protein BHE74_00059671, partial [Ensete ventricosum]
MGFLQSPKGQKSNSPYFRISYDFGEAPSTPGLTYQSVPMYRVHLGTGTVLVPSGMHSVYHMI